MGRRSENQKSFRVDFEGFEFQLVFCDLINLCFFVLIFWEFLFVHVLGFEFLTLCNPMTDILTSSELLPISIRGSGQNEGDESESTRLVPSNQIKIHEIHSTLLWWIKVLLGFSILLVLGAILIKWGVPFAFQKVLVHEFVIVCMYTATEVILNLCELRTAIMNYFGNSAYCSFK